HRLRSSRIVIARVCQHGGRGSGSATCPPRRDSCDRCVVARRIVYDVVIAGAGFAGIAMAIALKKEGIENFVVLEQANDVGGTWRDNAYPGCACDIPSMLYSFSFESNPHWSRVFPPQAEIWDYIRRCVEKYDLRKHIRFACEMVEARYDEPTATWGVLANNGDAF